MYRTYIRLESNLSLVILLYAANERNQCEYILHRCDQTITESFVGEMIGNSTDQNQAI